MNRGARGFNAASPGAIGGTTPGPITGTTITASVGYIAPIGLPAAPNYSYAGRATTGMYSPTVEGGNAFAAGGNFLGGFYDNTSIGLQIPIARPLTWGTSATIFTTGDTGLSRISPGVIGVGTGAAASVAGTISAAAYISGGSAGVDFGPAVATNITVKKGIITAIS